MPRPRKVENIAKELVEVIENLEPVQAEAVTLMARLLRDASGKPEETKGGRKTRTKKPAKEASDSSDESSDASDESSDESSEEKPKKKKKRGRKK